MRFDADLDHIDALAEERTLEWRRIGEAGFLTLDEQRAAAGYGPAPQGFAVKGSNALELRYSPDQPRAPAGASDGGRWVSAGGGGSGGGSGGGGGLIDSARIAALLGGAPTDTTQGILIAGNDDPNVANDAGGPILLAQNGPGRSSRLFPGPGGPTYGQLSRLEMAQEAAKQAITLVRAREPGWRPRTVLSDPKNTEAEIKILETQRSEALARLAEYAPRNSRGDFPSLSGRRAEINDKDDPVTRRSAFRENESADIFFANGHSVEQKPIIPGRKNPDYVIDGEVFDNYAPTTGNLRNIRGLIERKILENQTRNIILNMRDTSVTAKQIDDYLLLYPVEELNQIWIIDRMGQIHYLRGGKR